jgi:Flp pilus assembly secretin CpaC
MRWIALFAVLLPCLAARGEEPPLRVPAPVDARRAADHAELDRLEAEFAALRAKLTREPQLLLQVRIVRLRLDALRKLGFDVDRGVLALPGSAVTQRMQHVDAAKLRPGDLFLARLADWRADRAGLAKPVETTPLLSQLGKPSELTSGSDIPITLPQAMGKVGVEYVHHGVNLKAAPEWLDDGRIRLRLVTRSSEIHDPQSTTIDKQPVPSLRVASADLTVDLEPGEVVAVGGLVQKAKSGEATEETELLTIVSADDFVTPEADGATIDALKQLRKSLAEVRARIAEPQVAVRLRIYEIEAGTLDRLQAGGDEGVTKQASSQNMPSPATPNDSQPGRLVAQAAAEALISRFQEWLEKPDGPVTTAMDTTVVVPNGREVLLNSGGELPVLVPQALGRVTLEYRRFGEQLFARVERQNDGVLRLDVHPRVAHRDLARDVTINGHRIPGIAIFDFPLAADMTPSKPLLVGGLPRAMVLRRSGSGRAGQADPTDKPRDVVLLLSVDTVSNPRELVKTSIEAPLGRALEGVEAPVAQAAARRFGLQPGRWIPEWIKLK